MVGTWMRRIGLAGIWACGITWLGGMEHLPPPASPAAAGDQADQVFLPWIARGAGASTRIVNAGGGTTRALAAAGDVVYAGIEDRLALFDVADPAAPRMIAASRPLGAPVMDIAIVDRAVYVAAGAAGLHSFDVSGAAPPFPAAPLVPGGALGMGIGGSARDLAVVGGTWLYIATSDEGATGLMIVDIAEPLHPRVARRWDDIGNAWAIAAAERWVWLAHDGQTLRGFDVSDPSSPRSTGRFGNEGRWGLPLDLRLANGYAFIVAEAKDLRVFDVRNVVSTRDEGSLAAELALPHAAPSLAVSGDRLFIADSQAGVQVLDVRDPEKPAPAGSIPVAGGAQAVTIAGNRLYAGGASVQLAIFDLDTGGQATIRGTYTAPHRDATVVATTGRVMAAVFDAPAGERDLRADLGAFLAGQADLAVPAGILPLAAKPEDVKLTALRGRDYAYLLYYNALEAVDLTAPAKPEKRRTLAVPDATDFVVESNYLYVAGDGLRVIDISAADDPQPLAYQFRAGSGEAIAADGTLVYIAQRSPTGSRPTDLWVFDVTDRAHPRQVGTLGDIKTTVDMVAVGGYVYQVYDFNRGYGLNLIDARDPTHPRKWDMVYATDGYARAVIRAGTRLYLVEEAYFDRVARRERGRNGVHILDIRVPEHPRQVQFIAFPAPIGGIDVWGGRLYVAARQAGLVEIALEE